MTLLSDQRWTIDFDDMRRPDHALRIRAEWHFDNRQVDLVAEGYDAAIGGGFELASGMVSRQLAAAHIVAVASPEYMRQHAAPQVPTDLATLDGIAMRSTHTGRIRQWVMRDASGEEMNAPLKETFVVNEPAAMRTAAVLGLGVTLIAVPDVLRELESGELVRLLPRWYADAGAISLYFANRTLLPAKTRVFIDYVVEEFKRARLAERLAGSLG